MKLLKLLMLLLFPIQVIATIQDARVLSYEEELEEVQLITSNPKFKKLMYGVTTHYQSLSKYYINRFVLYGRWSKNLFFNDLSFELLPSVFCMYAFNNDSYYSDQKVISGINTSALVHVRKKSLNIVFPYLQIGYTLPNERLETFPSFRYSKGSINYKVALHIWYNHKFKTNN